MTIQNPRKSIQEELVRCLRLAWLASTSASPELWDRDNPEIGQCAVSALVIQDVLGGELVRGAWKGGSHYWNKLGDGLELDVTRSQFETPPEFDSVSAIGREYVLSYPETLARYNKLKKRVERLVAASISGHRPPTR